MKCGVCKNCIFLNTFSFPALCLILLLPKRNRAPTMVVNYLSVIDLYFILKKPIVSLRFLTQNKECDFTSSLLYILTWNFKTVE